jgi:hypothetical protein
MVDGVFIKESDNLPRLPDDWVESGVKVAYWEPTPEQLELDLEPKGYTHVYKNTIGGSTKY